MSGRILKAARDQQEEIDAEEAEQEQADQGRVQVSLLARLHGCACMSTHGAVFPPLPLISELLPAMHAVQISAGALAAALKRLEDSDDEADDDEVEDDPGFDDSVYAGAEEELDPNDEAALEAFMAPGHEGKTQLSLGDMIMNSLRAKQRAAGVAVAPE